MYVKQKAQIKWMIGKNKDQDTDLKGKLTGFSGFIIFLEKNQSSIQR